MALLNTKVEVNINTRNIAHYRNKGYEIPSPVFVYVDGRRIYPINILVDAFDLQPKANIKVQVQCDCCGAIHEITRMSYNDKRIQEIYDGKYYCGKCVAKLFRSGKNHHAWRDDITDKEREMKRNYSDYHDFVKRVLARDNYTCQCCGKRTNDIEVHHLDGFNWCRDKRTDETNGICLCFSCHSNYHSVYGRGDNTKEQFEEWLGRSVELLKYEGELPCARRVYCFEEDKVYDSAACVIQTWKLPKRSISRVYAVCNRKIITRESRTDTRALSVQGKHLAWYDEYLKMTEKDIENYFEYCIPRVSHIPTNFNEVVCLNTLQTFPSASEASRYLNNSESLSLTTHIISVCRKKRVTAGKDPVTGERLLWCYAEDLPKLQEQYPDIKEYIALRLTQRVENIHNVRKIICLNNLQIFPTLKLAGKFAKTKYDYISKCCKGERETAGKDPVTGEKLRWMYYEDYVKFNETNNDSQLLTEETI